MANDLSVTIAGTLISLTSSDVPIPSPAVAAELNIYAHLPTHRGTTITPHLFCTRCKSFQQLCDETPEPLSLNGEAFKNAVFGALKTTALALLLLGSISNPIFLLPYLGILSHTTLSFWQEEKINPTYLFDQKKHALYHLIFSALLGPLLPLYQALTAEKRVATYKADISLKMQTWKTSIDSYIQDSHTKATRFNLDSMDKDNPVKAEISQIKQFYEDLPLTF